MDIKKAQSAKRKAQNLKGKKILITAGPTQVKIDPVRVISNIATGETGKLLARLASRRGAKVTLLLGSANERIKGIRIKSFRFFQDLRWLVKNEISKHKFDCIIHNAAVSDFLVKREAKEKLDSDIKNLNVRLIRAPKIVDEIRKKAPDSLLIIFKLEPNVSDLKLIKRARFTQEKVKADIVVANTFKRDKLKGFIYNHRGRLGEVNSRKSLAKKLISILEKKL